MSQTVSSDSLTREHARKSAAVAVFGDTVASDLVDVSDNPACLDGSGWWAVTQTFEGQFRAYRFATVTQRDVRVFADTFAGLSQSQWQSSLTENQYVDAVNAVRSDIARGWVYQVNICRVLSQPAPEHHDPIGLYCLLTQHNPAPYSGALRIPAQQMPDGRAVGIASASPELFVSRNQEVIMSRPIKGTAKIADELLEKDRTENVMIVDLVRNDISMVATPGSVTVPRLLTVEEHPGLVHLVSDVQGELLDSVSWSDIFTALSPPGSVSGAPKSSALETIERLETSVRDIYCGAFGWVNADEKTAQLAVGIRTFWLDYDTEIPHWKFGTGAGITWGSEAQAEWAETELKAHKLFAAASQSYPIRAID